MAKYDVAERLAALTSRLEDQTAGEMLTEYKRALHAQFKVRKTQIEDWQDLTPEKQVQIRNRLQVIADKPVWTINNLLDMALITALLWNEEINGD